MLKTRPTGLCHNQSNVIWISKCNHSPNTVNRRASSRSKWAMLKQVELLIKSDNEVIQLSTAALSKTPAANFCTLALRFKPWKQFHNLKWRKHQKVANVYSLPSIQRNNSYLNATPKEPTRLKKNDIPGRCVRVQTHPNISQEHKHGTRNEYLQYFKLWPNR